MGNFEDSTFLQHNLDIFFLLLIFNFDRNRNSTTFSTEIVKVNYLGILYSYLEEKVSP